MLREPCFKKAGGGKMAAETGAKPVPVSLGQTVPTLCLWSNICPQAQPAPCLRVEIPPRYPVLFLVLKCAGPPLRLIFQLLCSAEGSQPCQTSTGDSGETPQLITPQQGKNWLRKAVAGKIITQGGGRMGCELPPPGSSAPSSAVTHKFTKMKSFPSRGCKKSAA